MSSSDGVKGDKIKKRLWRGTYGGAKAEGRFEAGKTAEREGNTGREAR